MPVILGLDERRLLPHFLLHLHTSYFSTHVSHMAASLRHIGQAEVCGVATVQNMAPVFVWWHHLTARMHGVMRSGPFSLGPWSWSTLAHAVRSSMGAIPWIMPADPLPFSKMHLRSRDMTCGRHRLGFPEGSNFTHLLFYSVAS